MRWYHWILAGLSVGLCFVAFLLGRRTTLPSLQTELGVLRAKKRARTYDLLLGSEQAQREIEHQYLQTLEAIDAQSEQTRQKMGKDPVALAAWLERLSRGE